MNIIKETVGANGLRRVTVVLGKGESLMAIRHDSHYKLGQPVDDIVGSHIIMDAEEVSWCSAQQAWVS